jgi:hypothetical protein
MDLDLHDIIGLLHAAARSVGAEVTSPWFYLQLGLILAGGGIAYASGAAIRPGRASAICSRSRPTLPSPG